MTERISNEALIKYLLSDDYPHDAVTLAAKEKIEELEDIILELQEREE